jgi:hypothetical protein
MPPDPDPLAAELTAICDRAEEMRSRDVWVRVKAAEADRDRLLGALGEVLKRHLPKTVTIRELCESHEAVAPIRLLTPAELDACLYCESHQQVECTGCDPLCPDDNLWEKCPEREAITSKLLGEGENRG